MELLFGLTFAQLYQTVIVPVAGGVLFLIRKLYLMEKDLSDKAREAQREASDVRSEVRLLEARLEGQVNTSNAHHQATQNMLTQMMGKLDALESHLRSGNGR